MITEDFVSYETARLLKEKGFDETVRCFYNTRTRIFCDDCVKTKNSYTENIAAPTLQMAMKWLREVHNRYVEICMDKAHNFKDIVFRPAIYDKSLNCLWESDNFPTYEEACKAAIKYCLENL